MINTITQTTYTAPYMFMVFNISCTVYSIFVARMVSNRMHKHELIFNENIVKYFLEWMGIKSFQI